MLLKSSTSIVLFEGLKAKDSNSSLSSSELSNAFLEAAGMGMPCVEVVDSFFPLLKYCCASLSFHSGISTFEVILEPILPLV